MWSLAAREELFGPVAVLYEVDSVDEAIGGQRLPVLPRQRRVPFGGVKNSGIGRELGRFGLDEFANTKLVRIA